MKKIKKYYLLSILAILIISAIAINTFSQSIIVNAVDDNFDNCKSYVLIESNSHQILTEKSSHEKLPIASVTKLMTILLTLENINDKNISLDDRVIVSENASAMGGSQIFLDANQEYELSNLLKSVIVASANDSSVALAELIAGSENNFVNLMNERAIELNMLDTNYANCTGLPCANGYSSAYDQAILLSEILKYDTYREYASIWNEDFVHPTGRTTQMTNTNKLSRFYNGCLGGKTGSTNEAKYCLAVGATRNNNNYIAVVLGADTTKDRFAIASNLLNYGFNNYTTKIIFSNENVKDIVVSIKGNNRSTHVVASKDYTIISKINEETNYSINYTLPDQLKSVQKGDVIGSAEIVVHGIVVDNIDLIATDTHDEASIWDNFKEIMKY